MKNTKKCENCIWFDKCAQAEACEDYDPVSPDEDSQEYEDDLRERYEYYQELVEEQNT